MGPTDPSIWNEEIPVPVSTISYVDEAVAKSEASPGNNWADG
jgi:hypothetical protein